MFKKGTRDPVDIYGPYIRSSKNDKWHWMVKCSQYPKVKDPIVRYSSTRPQTNELCTECLKLEEKK